MKKLVSLLLCLALCMGLTIPGHAAGKTYEGAVEELRKAGYEGQTYDSDLCTLFSYSVTAPHGPFAHLDLVYKAGSPLGEGTVVSLPIPSQNAWGASSAPETMTWDPEGGRLTYSYYFDTPIYTEDPSSIRREAGTFTYTVDLHTGEVTETLTPLSADGTYLISITTSDGVVTSGYRSDWRWVALSRADPGRPGILLRGEDADVTGSLTRSDGLTVGDSLDAWGKEQDGKPATLTLGKESWECIVRYKDYGWQSVLYVDFLPRKDGGGYIRPDSDTLCLFRYIWAQNAAVERKTYEEAVAELQSGNGYTTEQVFDSDYGTVFLYNYGSNPAGIHGFLTLVTKAPCSRGEGVVIGLPQPRNSLFCITKPPHAAELSGDGKSFTYSYHYDHPVLSHEGEFLRPAGDFSYSVDLTTGKVTDSYTPLGYEKTLATLTQAEGYVVDQLLESSAATAVLRHQEFPADNGDPAYRDYQLYLVFKDDNAPEAFRGLLLPSTLYLTHRAYAPTDRAPDALALCADGKTLTYNYFFDAPLSNGDTVYHEAGTYTYIVDTATGELEVTHTDQVPSPPQPAVSGFSDVPAGSWFETGVVTCAGKGVMVGTGGDSFSPERKLSQAECLTLAFRLYDLMRGNEHVLEKAPEDWGKMTLTLADGTVFEGYGYQSEADCVFSWWSGRNGYEGACAQVPGWSYEDMEAGARAQREWIDTHRDICGTDAPATLTLNGVTYQGTANCWMPVGPFVFQFQPETEKTSEVNRILHHAVYREMGPDHWWRDTAYTIVQRGLEDIFDPAEFSDAPASRSFFAQLIADACEGHLEKINTIGDIPDLPREFPGPVTYPQAELYRDAVYALYEAGILTGVDQAGTFAADNTLTRAEAAVMAARVLDPAQRLSSPPTAPNAYEQAVIDLRGSWGYRNEQTFEAPDCTIFVYDPGGIMQRSYGAITLIYKPGSQLGAGTVIGLPHARVQYTVVGYPADAMTLSEDGKTFTYTYYRPEDIVGWVEGVNEGEVLEKAGCVTYTVDLPSGAVTERFDPPNYQAALAHVMKKRIITPSEHSEDREVVQILEADECTVVLTKGRFVDQYDDYILSLVYKPGSALGDGTIRRLILPTTVIATGYWRDPTDRAPDSLELSEDGKTLTYTYRFEDALTNENLVYHNKGTYIYTVDLATAQQSVELVDAYEKSLVDAIMTDGSWQVDERLETPLCTILMQHSEGGDGVYPLGLHLPHLQGGLSQRRGEGGGAARPVRTAPVWLHSAGPGLPQRGRDHTDLRLRV